MSKDINDVTSHIWDHVNNVFDGSQKRTAEAYGVSESYLSDVLNMRRSPGKKLLDALNMKAVVYYEYKD